MPREIDALTSSTLKHVRDRWWDQRFTDFLYDHLQPRAGRRVLDVGCGGGTAEINLGLSRPEDLRLVGIDSVRSRAYDALSTTRDRNLPASFAVADGKALPFLDASFDATFCVGVLQHITDPSAALREFARVTRPAGRILAVEPDNAARYWFSSIDSGRRAYETSARFFASLSRARGDDTDPAIGPKLPSLLRSAGIEPLTVHLFPVSLTRLGAPPASLWNARRLAVRQAIEHAPDEALKRWGNDYLRQIDRYAAEADIVGPEFVEVQNTLLFAVLGQKLAG